ncbi:MAG: hypothetical protein ACR2J5_12100, partial [Geodermatophilaceae bacterium]
MAQFFSLHVGAIVGVAWPRPGEGDLPLGPPVEQVMVDELAAVVGVHPDDRERHDRGDVGQRL